MLDRSTVQYVLATIELQKWTVRVDTYDTGQVIYFKAYAYEDKNIFFSTLQNIYEGLTSLLGERGEVLLYRISTDEDGLFVEVLAHV